MLLIFFPDVFSACGTVNKSKTNENLVNCNGLYHPSSNYFPYTGSPKGTWCKNILVIYRWCFNGINVKDGKSPEKILIFKEAQTQRELRASLSSHLLLLPPSLSPVSRVRRFSSGGEDDGWNQNINRVNKPTFSLSELLVIRSMTAHTIVPSLSLLHRASGGWFSKRRWRLAPVLRTTSSGGADAVPAAAAGRCWTVWNTAP